MSAADFSSKDWTWPAKPDGDMAPILEASIEAEQAKNAEGIPPGAIVTGIVLTAADRCDAGCGAAAVYRVSAGLNPLDYCGHHWRKFKPSMTGWTVIGVNAELA